MLSGYFNGHNEPYRTYGSHTFNPVMGGPPLLRPRRGGDIPDENLDGMFTRSYKMINALTLMALSASAMEERRAGMRGIYSRVRNALILETR
jgi:hypothetical protein